MSQPEYQANESSSISTGVVQSRAACVHVPACPAADGPDRDAAHVIVGHPEQGWSLLCNGVVLFEDSGEILPDGHCLQARRADLTASALHRVAC
jgi:hypothetical protein